jgi:hypothetical protein
MKTLITAILVVAIANLLGVLGFLGWLGATDRLSKDRFNRIKEILAVTNAEELALAATEKAKAETQAKETALAAKMAEPPKSAAESISDNRQSGEIQQQGQLRLRDELRQLQLQLDRRQAELDATKAQLDAKERTFQQRLAEVGKAAANEQFKQALAALEAQEPADAQKVLSTIIQDRQQEQAVSYLASMSPKNRAAVITEFIAVDPKLAATLLEELRTRGLSSTTAASPQPTTPR